MRVLVSVIAVVVLAFCGLAAPLSAQSSSATSSAPRASTAATDQLVLKSGDVVRIIVWRVPELSGEFAVTPGGFLEHPLYRHVQVTGVPVTVAEQRVREYLSRFEANPEAVIQPLIHVWVAGEVGAPGVRAVPPGTNLEQALMAAGGPTRDSRLERIVIFREGERMLVDMTDFDPQMRSFFLRSGDKVIVEKRRSILREYVAPVASVISAVAGVIRITRYLR
jgi:protein involved in polysaccharide export with SLBB domain